ncbi:MAG: helix-turn-helix transcriptional regulator [Actinomycetota bacterium]|nr:helix-turn-helix transcriptional regulator [Actinomycetota bacterium]
MSLFDLFQGSFERRRDETENRVQRLLTERESRIAAPAAARRTSGEIAVALAVSPKTVEWNLTRIYRKLGVRGRTELAAIAVARGPLTGGSPWAAQPTK